MVRIGTVWDRTVKVIGGRRAILGSIAIATLFLPAVIRDAWAAYTAPGGMVAIRTVGGILGLLTVLVMLYGQVALTAVASDPGTTRDEAYRIAGRRLGAAIGIAAIAVVVSVVVFVPLAFLLVGAGFDVRIAAAGGTQPDLSPGGVLATGLYMIVLGVAFVIVAARLVVLWPVIVNERLGLGAFARAFRLTHGLTWKLVGVLILYVIVVLVAVAASTTIVGIVFRLMLGVDNIATAMLFASMAGAVVTTIFAVVQIVFAAQLYVGLCDRDPEAYPAQ